MRGSKKSLADEDAGKNDGLRNFLMEQWIGAAQASAAQTLEKRLGK